MRELTEIDMAEQRRATYAAFDDAQELARYRTAALCPWQVTYPPGSTDKQRARLLRRRAESGKPFTPRQLQVAAYLAWRYRRQISGRLVPAAPVSKP